MSRNSPVANVAIPTEADYLAYSGGHCAKQWAKLDDYWRCPGCSRTKFQLLEFKAGISSDRIRGPVEWRAAIHTHHDHRSDYGLMPRFAATPMCGACNSADGYVKRKLKLPLWFSFAPGEIHAFVSAQAHGPHVINLFKATELWESLRGAFRV